MPGAHDSRLATKEIVDFHEFLESWFRGLLPKDEAVFDTFAARLRPKGLIIQPSGSEASLDDFANWLWGAHGINDAFRIQIRNCQVLEVLEGGAQLVRYEEWQKGAKNSDPPNNARVATVLLEPDSRAANGLVWLHVHETDLPRSRVAEDPFDF